MTPLKKRIKLTLDPTVYSAFQLLCKKQGYRFASKAIEAFMHVCLLDPGFLKLTFELEAY